MESGNGPRPQTRSRHRLRQGGGGCRYLSVRRLRQTQKTNDRSRSRKARTPEGNRRGRRGSESRYGNDSGGSPHPCRSPSPHPYPRSRPSPSGLHRPILHAPARGRRRHCSAVRSRRAASRREAAPPSGMARGGLEHLQRGRDRDVGGDARGCPQARPEGIRVLSRQSHHLRTRSRGEWCDI